MRKSFIAAAVYLGLGLVSGVFYREFTRAFDYTADTQLNTLHTHFLVLGTFFFLIVMSLDREFEISQFKDFDRWFVVHNVGLAWTIGSMVINGVVHVVAGPEAWGAMYSGAAGLGHIILAVSFIWFFRILSRGLKRTERALQAKVSS